MKYRATPVDLADPRFEYIDMSRSSFVEGAWYDASNEYLVLRLRTTYYQYCRVPADEWRSFYRANSFGQYYNSRIKGRYDCRSGGVPAY